jgi:hypothetical protein
MSLIGACRTHALSPSDSLVDSDEVPACGAESAVTEPKLLVPLRRARRRSAPSEVISGNHCSFVPATLPVWQLDGLYPTSAGLRLAADRQPVPFIRSAFTVLNRPGTFGPWVHGHPDGSIRLVGKRSRRDSGE